MKGYDMPDTRTKLQLVDLFGGLSIIFKQLQDYKLALMVLVMFEDHFNMNLLEAANPKLTTYPNACW